MGKSNKVRSKKVILSNKHKLPFSFHINILDKDYIQWIKDLSSRYRRSQIKASVKVNQEMLQFYWELGKDIVERDAENRYGARFYASLSRDLKVLLPDATGLSERNLYYMKKFYCLYKQVLDNLQQVVADSDKEISQQVAAKLFTVPWVHHMLLIDKLKNDYKKAWFYICEIIENGWSRDMLLNFMVPRPSSSPPSNTPSPGVKVVPMSSLMP